MYSQMERLTVAPFPDFDPFPAYESSKQYHDNHESSEDSIDYYDLWTKGYRVNKIRSLTLRRLLDRNVVQRVDRCG